MPRYYIDVKSHFGIDEDTNGIELPDIAAARIEALKVAEQLLKSWAGMLPHYSSEIVVEVGKAKTRIAKKAAKASFNMQFPA